MREEQGGARGLEQAARPSLQHAAPLACVPCCPEARASFACMRPAWTQRAHCSHLRGRGLYVPEVRHQPQHGCGCHGAACASAGLRAALRVPRRGAAGWRPPGVLGALGAGRGRAASERDNRQLLGTAGVCRLCTPSARRRGAHAARAHQQCALWLHWAASACCEPIKQTLTLCVGSAASCSVQRRGLAAATGCGSRLQAESEDSSVYVCV